MLMLINQIEAKIQQLEMQNLSSYQQNWYQLTPRLDNWLLSWFQFSSNTLNIPSIATFIGSLMLDSVLYSLSFLSSRPGPSLSAEK